MENNSTDILEAILQLAAEGFTTEYPRDNLSLILERAYYARYPVAHRVEQVPVSIEVLTVQPASNWVAYYVDGHLTYSGEAYSEKLKAWVGEVAIEMAETYHGATRETTQVVYRQFSDLPGHAPAKEQALFQHTCELPATVAELTNWLALGRRP